MESQSVQEVGFCILSKFYDNLLVRGGVAKSFCLLVWMTYVCCPTFFSLFLSAASPSNAVILVPANSASSGGPSFNPPWQQYGAHVSTICLPALLDFTYANLHPYCFVDHVPSRSCIPWTAFPPCWAATPYVAARTTICCSEWSICSSRLPQLSSTPTSSLSWASSAACSTSCWSLSWAYSPASSF